MCPLDTTVDSNITFFLLLHVNDKNLDIYFYIDNIKPLNGPLHLSIHLPLHSNHSIAFVQVICTLKGFPDCVLASTDNSK